MASVTGSAGEAAKGRWLLDWLRRECAVAPGLELQLIASGSASGDKELPGSVLAWLPADRPLERAADQSTGQEGQGRRALLLLGHYDTVGLEPYGELARAAHDSTALRQVFSTPGVAADPDLALLAAHAASPDWVFGRGWLDMQGGVASALLAFRHFARSSGRSFDLVLLLCPDEERDSAGVRSAIPALLELQARAGLSFGGLLNVDYCTPGEQHERRGHSRRQPSRNATEPDLRGVLFSGTIGKLLLGVSVFGLPTHAAEPFAGLNSAALAGCIAAALEQAGGLRQSVEGQLLPPPSLLELRTRRERYDVMTVQCSELYVNCFHGGGELDTLWRRLAARVRSACRGHLRELRYRQRSQRLRGGADLALDTPGVEVLDFAELATRARALNPAAAQAALELQYPGGDGRETALARVRALEELLPRGRARVVLSLLPPFYPARRADPARARRLRALAARLGLRWQPLYPFISDMSYFCFEPAAQQPGAEAKLLAGLMPLRLAESELELYQQAAMPVCNIGPLGLGAHSAFERVYAPQLAELPEKLIAALDELAQ